MVNFLQYIEIFLKIKKKIFPKNLKFIQYLTIFFRFFLCSGFVGNPLPNVTVRIVDNGEVLVEGNEFFTKVMAKHSSRKDKKLTGELQVRGDNVFKEYWGKPDVTRESFTDGWFLTGKYI